MTVMFGRVLVLLLLAVGCGGHAINAVPLVRMSPIVTSICADTTFQGQPAKIVTLLVVQPFGESAQVTVLVGGAKYAMRTAYLNIPSGLGHHRVEVWVGERHYVRSYTIWNCP